MNTTLPTVAALLLALGFTSAARAVPDGPLGELSTPGAVAAPEGAMAARLAYNLGYDAFEKGDFPTARDKFESAAKADPELKEAWNMIGHVSRRLADYDRSLVAYDKALALDPAYPEAIEYRAETFLALNRLDDAKAAYLGLLASSRSHADVLLESMRQWVAARRRAPAGVAASDIDAFAKWVEARGTIARQTASMNLGRAVVHRWD
ncbi:MAG: hypothetical protein RLZZ200_1133 [Pseudomonadota bacterium]|jgi:tetratricopeptide (TPR) repeat protein